MKLPLPLALAAEKAIESVLRLDPQTRARLAALNGKTVCINVNSPALTVLFSIVDGRIFINQHDTDTATEQQADIVISGSLADLRSLLDGNEAIYKGAVRVEGDLGTSAQLRQIIADLDIDWQELVSAYLGDTITHRLDTAQADFRRWLTRTRQATRQNTRDYLQEELELVAAKAQVRQFCTDVDELRAASDRLAARIQRLEASVERQRSGS